MSVLSMAMGGHARAGFEDNATYHPGEPAASNAQLIERLVRLGRETGEARYLRFAADLTRLSVVAPRLADVKAGGAR